MRKLKLRITLREIIIVSLYLLLIIWLPKPKGLISAIGYYVGTLVAAIVPALLWQRISDWLRTKS